MQKSVAEICGKLFTFKNSVKLSKYLEIIFSFPLYLSLFYWPMERYGVVYDFTFCMVFTHSMLSIQINFSYKTQI